VREFTIGDLGIGECAGEVVSLFGIEVVKAESQSFDAQIALDEGEVDTAEELAYAAMLSAARALVRTEFIDVTEDPDEIVREFKTRFFDTERFFDRFAKGKFGLYLLDRHGDPGKRGVPADRRGSAVHRSLPCLRGAARRRGRNRADRRDDARLLTASPLKTRQRSARRAREDMTPQRIAAKLFTTDPSAPVELHPFIGLFHRFIQQAAVPGLLIDVADYSHVPEGPGVMLIGHEVDYGIDFTGGRRGLLTVRKRGGSLPIAELLRDTLRKALTTARAIEAADDVDVHFATGAVQVQFPDRLVAPNADQSYEVAVKELEPVARELYGDGFGIERQNAADPRQMLALRLSGDAADIATLLGRLGEVPMAAPGSWEIDVEDLKQLREGDGPLQLIDVRESREREICHIGGELIPLGTLGAKLGDLDRSAHIVVYCRSGARSAKAVAAMRDAGFENVWNLQGGILAWIDRIDPSLTKY